MDSMRGVTYFIFIQMEPYKWSKLLHQKWEG